MKREKVWWLKNRIHIEVFATELEAGLRLLSVLPGAGTPYTKVSIPGLRRWYLPVNHNNPPAQRLREIFRTGTRRQAYIKVRDANRILQNKDLMARHELVRN